MQEDLKNWKPCAEPNPAKLTGKHVTITAYVTDDAKELWQCFGATAFNDLAKYFPNPDFANFQEFRAWLDSSQKSLNTLVFRDPQTNSPIGMASYMRIDAANGVCEVGAVCHGPKMQKSTAATEAHYLMAKHVFDDLGYRRYEWKLNNLNAPSHASAKRLGFTFEGIFRQHIISKGENRDTAWYAMINHDWPEIRNRFEAWLDPSNFYSDGTQKKKLEEMRT